MTNCWNFILGEGVTFFVFGTSFIFILFKIIFLIRSTVACCCCAFSHHPDVPSPWENTWRLFPWYGKGSADKDGWFGAERRGLQPPPRSLSFKGGLLRYGIIPACWHHPCLVRFAGVHYQGTGWQRARSLASLVMLGEQYLWKQRISYSRPDCYANWTPAAFQPKR